MKYSVVAKKASSKEYLSCDNRSTFQLMCSNRIELARKPVKCPTCQSKPVAVILYGFPAFSSDLEQKLSAGLISLGGCSLSGDDPAWRCATCGQEIYRKAPFTFGTDGPQEQ